MEYGFWGWRLELEKYKEVSEERMFAVQWQGWGLAFNAVEINARFHDSKSESFRFSSAD